MKNTKKIIWLSFMILVTSVTIQAMQDPSLERFLAIAASLRKSKAKENPFDQLEEECLTDRKNIEKVYEKEMSELKGRKGIEAAYEKRIIELKGTEERSLNDVSYFEEKREERERISEVGENYRNLINRSPTNRSPVHSSSDGLSNSPISGRNSASLVGSFRQPWYME